MNTLTTPTIAGAVARSNGLGLRAAHTGVRATHGAPWPVRTAAAYALSSIGSPKALMIALGRSRPAVSRMISHGSTPVAEAAEVVYQVARRGLNTEPVIDAIRAAAELGAREHARRFGAGRLS